jgi:hypothetical protein
VKAQFEAHVNMHKQMQQRAQMMNFLNMIPSDGTDGEPPDMNVSLDQMLPGDALPGDLPSPDSGPPGASMAANGAVPAPDLTTTGG